MVFALAPCVCTIMSDSQLSDISGYTGPPDGVFESVCEEIKSLGDLDVMLANPDLRNERFRKMTPSRRYFRTSQCVHVETQPAVLQHGGMCFNMQQIYNTMCSY